MTQEEKLVKAFVAFEKDWQDGIDDEEHNHFGFEVSLANYLTRNGVVVPKFKSEDIVFWDDEFGKIIITKVDSITIEGSDIYVDMHTDDPAIHYVLSEEWVYRVNEMNGDVVYVHYCDSPFKSPQIKVVCVAGVTMMKTGTVFMRGQDGTLYTNPIIYKTKAQAERALKEIKDESKKM